MRDFERDYNDLIERNGDKYLSEMVIYSIIRDALFRGNLDKLEIEDFMNVCMSIYDNGLPNIENLSPYDVGNFVMYLNEDKDMTVKNIYKLLRYSVEEGLYDKILILYNDYRYIKYDE